MSALLSGRYGMGEYWGHKEASSGISLLVNLEMVAVEDLGTTATLHDNM